MALLNGRECGACTVCCRILPVNTEGLRKTANVLCAHCDEGRGCRIHEARPRLCRDFYCEWRLSPNLPATWRPDRSGVFVQRIAREHLADIPPRYDAAYAVLFMLLRSDAIERPALIETIADHVLRRIAAFLAIPGPAGYLPAQIFLNEAMESAATQHDLHAMTVIVRQAAEALKRERFDPVPDFV